MRLNPIVSFTVLACSRLAQAGARAGHLRGLSEDGLLVLPTRGETSQLQRADVDPPLLKAPAQERGWETADQLLVPAFREPGLFDLPLLERPALPVAMLELQEAPPSMPLAMLEVQEAPRQVRPGGWSLFSGLQAVHTKISDAGSAVASGTASRWEAAVARVEAYVGSFSWRFKALLASLFIASFAFCTAGLGYQLGRKDEADQALRGGSTNEWWA